MLRTVPFWSGECLSPNIVGLISRVGVSSSFIPDANAADHIFDCGTLQLSSTHHDCIIFTKAARAFPPVSDAATAIYLP